MLKNWAVQKRTESSLLTSGKDAMETLERQAFLRKYNNEKCYEFKGSKPTSNITALIRLESFILGLSNVEN